MYQILNEKELLVAKNIVNIALANSAESFSKLAKKNFQLHCVEIPPSSPANDLNRIINSEEELYVLITEIKGDLPAESFLVFTPANAVEIVKLLLPSESVKEMIEPILMEIDNILTASVVTQFSNFMNIKCYGDVPQLRKLNKNEIENLIRMKMHDLDVRVSFKTSFVADQHNVHPEFIWLFDHSLVDHIRETAKDDEMIASMENHQEKLNTYMIFS